jgi:outer membrane protein assembly factor BamB
VKDYDQLSTKPLFAAPAVIEDIVLFGANDGNLYVNKTNGTNLVRFKVGSSIFSGIAISNGRIYFGAQNGNIYCMSPNAQ